MEHSRNSELQLELVQFRTAPPGHKTTQPDEESHGAIKHSSKFPCVSFVIHILAKDIMPITRKYGYRTRKGKYSILRS